MTDSSRGSGSAPDFTSKMIDRLSLRRERSSRYREEGEIASGGMGAILRVWDEDLRRHLAMKVVRGEREGVHTPTPETGRLLLGRFLEEAQVTGQLDHPGIVPVHELGLDALGRVYFTMKLVKGRDLAAIFDLVRAEQEGWSQVKALGVLLRVCEAMSYAHDKGVIHRDLKPANVMVGGYGEVYVMDWGLAKVLGDASVEDVDRRTRDAASPSEIRTDRRDQVGHESSSSLHTMHGDVVGTPAYMSPEQAEGELDAMGPHSDVYAVGAMLYDLLAGHKPYVTEHAELSNVDIWHCVRRGPPPSLQQEAPKAPAELIAICERAMARDPRERYRDMSALAADLSAYLEDRVVSAYETGAIAELKKWVERNKALAAASAAAVLLLVVGLVVSSTLYAKSDRNERIALDNARIATEKSDEARRAALDARAREEEATREAQRANQLAAFLGKVLGGVDPAFAQGVDTTLLERILGDTAARIDTELGGEPRVERDVRTLLSNVYHSLGKYAPSLAHAERTVAIHEALGTLSAPTGLSMRQSVAVLKSSLGRSSEALLELTAARDDALQALGSEHELYDSLRCQLGVVLMDQKAYERAAVLFEETFSWRLAHYGEDHEETFAAMNSLALVRAYQGQNDEAESLMKDLLERRERVSGPRHPETIKAVANLGSFYVDLRRFTEAEGMIRRAHAASVVVLGEEHPSTLRYLVMIARVLRQSDRFRDAQELYERALEMQRGLFGPEHPDTLESEKQLGYVHRNLGDHAEAERLHQHVLDVVRLRHGDRAAETLIAELELAFDWMRSGLRADDCLATLERLAEEMPQVLGERHDRTLLAWRNLGEMYRKLGRLADAESVLRRSLEGTVARVGPDHPDTLIVERFLGLTLKEAGRPAEGVPHLAAMLGGWRRLDGDDFGLVRRTAEDLLACAALVEDLGPMEPHLATLVAHQRGRKPVDRQALARSLVLLAESHAANRRYDDSAALIDEAVALLTSTGSDGGPSAARAFGTLGAIKLARGESDAAEPLLVQCWEGTGEQDLVAKRRAALSLAEVHEARGDADGAALWRERARE